MIMFVYIDCISTYSSLIASLHSALFTEPITCCDSLGHTPVTPPVARHILIKCTWLHAGDKEELQLTTVTLDSSVKEDVLLMKVGV